MKDAYGCEVYLVGRDLRGLQNRRLNSGKSYIAQKVADHLHFM